MVRPSVWRDSSSLISADDKLAIMKEKGSDVLAVPFVSQLVLVRGAVVARSVLSTRVKGGTLSFLVAERKLFLADATEVGLLKVSGDSILSLADVRVEERDETRTMQAAAMAGSMLSLIMITP